MPTGRPRVLQVALSLDPGGTERLIVELVKRVHQQIPTAVCCLDGKGLWAPEVEALGVPVVPLNRPAGFHLATAARLADVIAETGATLLHCHQYSPFVYGRLASVRTRTPIVFTEHGRHSDAPPSRKRALVNRLLARGVPALYAVSGELRRHMLAEGFPARVGVIWNGIEPGDAPSAEERLAVRRALGIEPDAVVVGSIGRLDPVKDFPTLVAAFARARASQPGMRLVIIGDGPERAAIENAVAAVGAEGSIRLLGHRQDARALLAAVDIYANSSISEGISLTLLEAMAACCPIVATAVGGTPEVVQHESTGILVPPRSPEAMGIQLEALAAAPDRARRYREAGRARVLEHFTLDRMVGAYRTLYERNGRP